MQCENCGIDITPDSEACPVCGFMHQMDDEDTPRTAREIAGRVIILSAVIACAYGDNKRANIKWLKKEGLWQAVSPNEKSFMAGKHSKQDKVNFTWRLESLVPMMWAIQKIDKMTPLSDQCDTGPIKAAVVWPPNSTAEFLDSAKLRPGDEIEDHYEMVYQAHWQIRDAELNGKPLPPNFDAGVVYERHYALNWILGYMGQPWDEISTDT